MYSSIIGSMWLFIIVYVCFFFCYDFLDYLVHWFVSPILAVILGLVCQDTTREEESQVSKRRRWWRERQKGKEGKEGKERQEKEIEVTTIMSQALQLINHTSHYLWTLFLDHPILSQVNAFDLSVQCIFIPIKIYTWCRSWLVKSSTLTFEKSE